MKSLWAMGLIALCGMAQAAQAVELAYLVRATELKAKPFADAATLATLAEQSRLEVLARQASWMQVKTEAGVGWVKMLSVRRDNSGAPGSASGKSGDSGLGKLFNLATTGSSGSTVTTGVRGLSEEQLQNAQPNPEAFKTLQGYATKKDEAQKFAKTGALKAEKLDYLGSSKAADTPATTETGDK